MKPDFSVIDKLGLALPPVGVFYDLFRPEGLPQLDKSIEKSLCEIFRYAQETNEAFYFAKDNKENCVGKIMVGMDSFPPAARRLRRGALQRAALLLRQASALRLGELCLLRALRSAHADAGRAGLHRDGGAA